jgi:hypothetical protein
MPEASGKELLSIRLEVRHLPRPLLFGLVMGKVGGDGATEATGERRRRQCQAHASVTGHLAPPGAVVLVVAMKPRGGLGLWTIGAMTARSTTNDKGRGPHGKSRLEPFAEEKWEWFF